MDRCPLNAVDGMILARFAYIPFEHFSDPLPEEFVTVREIARRAGSDRRLGEEGRWKLRDEELIQAMGRSERFGPLGVGFHTERLDPVVQTQFSAVTVRLGDELHFLSYRGTDNTVVGWKEDLNMSFLCPIPGQRMAAEYAERVAGLIPGRLILGGHSKGGNLAVYAGAFCGEEVQKRIDGVYNYDGPGFYDNVLKTEGYRRIYGRVHTYIPQFSVVGMLLGREGKRAVVHSTESGLMQHDVYSWEALGPDLVRLPAVTDGSRFVDSTIKDWIADMTPGQFGLFVDAIYTLLSGTKRETMHEMRENWFDTARSFLRSVADMDDRTRDAALEALKILARSAEKEVKEALQGT